MSWSMLYFTSTRVPGYKHRRPSGRRGKLFKAGERFRQALAGQEESCDHLVDPGCVHWTRYWWFPYIFHDVHRFRIEDDDFQGQGFRKRCGERTTDWTAAANSFLSRSNWSSSNHWRSSWAAFILKLCQPQRTWPRSCRTRSACWCLIDHNMNVWLRLVQYGSWIGSIAGKLFGCPRPYHPWQHQLRYGHGTWLLFCRYSLSLLDWPRCSLWHMWFSQIIRIIIAKYWPSLILALLHCHGCFCRRTRGVCQRLRTFFVVRCRQRSALHVETVCHRKVTCRPCEICIVN